MKKIIGVSQLQCYNPLFVSLEGILHKCVHLRIFYSLITSKIDCFTKVFEIIKYL